MTDPGDGGNEFRDRVAIVTGGTLGIGLAVAEQLARAGARLILVGRDAGRLAAVAEALPTEAFPVAGDVADAETGRRAADLAMSRFGRLDSLCNIAGVFPAALLDALDEALFATTLATNLTGTYAMCRAAMPALQADGGGTIVNMSSMAARFPTPGLSAYSAAKAGVEAFTRAIAAEAAPLVRANTVSAGPTLTETVRTMMDADETGAVAAVTRSLPLGRLAEPAEIAAAVLFLAGPRSSCITGQTLHANCGGLMA